MTNDVPLVEPESFDVLVLGSSLQNCLIAAALAKAKRQVLILEGQDCYGGESSSFSIHCLREAAKGMHPTSFTAHEGEGAPNETKAQPDTYSDVAASDGSMGRKLVPLAPFALPIDRVTHLPGNEAVPSSSRAYVIDLEPKSLYQGEALVDALVASRSHHYIEFKRLEGCYITRVSDQGKATFHPVPASKSDVFRDKTLSIAEKRSLMSFLTSALEASKGEGRLKEVFSDKCTSSLSEVLESEGLSERLRGLVLHGIVMSGESIRASSGARVLQLLVQSMSRFSGPSESSSSSSSSSSSLASAFMVPSWGCGSIPEAFVRCCAVSGGTTVLRCPVSSISLVKREGTDEGSDSWRVEGVVTSRGQLIQCSHLVADPGTARQLLDAQSACSQASWNNHHWCYRALVVMDSSLVEGQSSLSFVMPNLPKAISGLQMSSAMGVCPNGQYLLYLTTPCDGDERLDEGYGGLQGALDALLSCPSEESKRPRSLEAFLYRQRVDAEIDRLREGTLLPHNLVTISTNGPMHSDCRNLSSHDARAGAMGLAGHLSTMALAEEAFKSHFPGVNWLTDLMEEESSRQDHEDGDRDEIDDLQSALQDLIPQTSASLNKDTV